MNQKTIIYIIVIFAFVIFGKTVFSGDFIVAKEQIHGSADITTHEILSGDVILGISNTGGGYINKLFVPGIGDILGRRAARYGRGGQVSLRDELHSRRYNPTQGGFTDRAGTFCVVEKKSNNLLFVPPRPCSLWHGDRKYDFTEWENLAKDPYVDDHGNTDLDGLNELKLIGKQATEITSEFDFTATYENAQDVNGVVIPAFKIYFEFRFVRPPGHCLKQFGKQTPIYNSSAEKSDRSMNFPPGNHPSSEGSLTGTILSATLRGDKAIWDPRFVFLGENRGNELTFNSEGRSIRQEFIENQKVTKLPLIIYSRSEDPDKGPAIGYFLPDNQINKFNIIGRSFDDGSIVYEDNRNLRGILLGDFARTPHLWVFGVRTFQTGILNTNETPKGVYESIRGETYIFIGTPREILNAANSIVK